MSILKLGILKDENFKIGARTIKLIALNGQGFTLEVKGEAMNQRFEIEAHPTEIFPGVTVKAGKSEFYYREDNNQKVQRAVVIIEAPLEVVIHRFKGPERFAA
jgi:hypothetical protein